MATLATTVFWAGLRHPVRSLQKQWSKRAPLTQASEVTQAAPVKSRWSEPDDEPPVVRYGAASPERLERIAAYARCGYFHMEYTAGMFVVPLDLPPE